MLLEELMPSERSIKQQQHTKCCEPSRYSLLPEERSRCHCKPVTCFSSSDNVRKCWLVLLIFNRNYVVVFVSTLEGAGDLAETHPGTLLTAGTQ